MKKFFIVASHLSDDMLQTHTYEPADNPDLSYGQTHFPAIPLIASALDEGETVKVVCVTYDIPNCYKNLKLFESELADLCLERGSNYELESIVAPFDDGVAAMLDIYRQLIARVNDGDELYADITFGSKPLPIVLVMAMQYAYRIKDNASIECVTYGQVSHHLEGKPAKIYDVTALVQLDEIVNLLEKGDVADPVAVIDRIIG